MKFRTTLILLVLVIACAAYLFYVDRYKPSTEELKRVEKRVFRDFEPAQVVRILLDVTQRDSETGAVTGTQHFELDRDSAGWNLLKPVNFPADETLVRQVLDLTKKLDQAAVLIGDEYESLNRADAGLDTPDVIATFEMPSTSITVRIGLKDSVGWNCYAEIEGRNAAYLVPSNYKELLALKTDDGYTDARRRLVFDVRPLNVSGLLVERPGATIECRRGDDTMWRLAQPVADAADDLHVQKLVDKLANLKVSSFVDEPTNFGPVRLTITLVQGPLSQRLQIGSQQGDKLLARRSEYQQYVEIPAADLAEFMLPAETYRSKLLVIRNPFEEPVHLTQEAGGETLEFDLEDGAWHFAGSSSPLLDELRIEDYVAQWGEITITNFVDAAVGRAALSSVWIALSFTYKDIDKPVVFTLSEPAGGLVYSERTPGTFVALDAAAVAALLATNELPFLTDEPVAWAAGQIKEIKAETPAASVSFVKGSNGWVRITSEGAADSEEDIDAVLSHVLPVAAARWVAKVDEGGLARYGLAPAAAAFTFVNDIDGSAAVRVGNECPDGRHAQIAGQPYVFVLAEDKYDALAELLPPAGANPSSAP
ncbi:DUF4340 domain-containing protein [bacterium]|nr:DUF4340 domain-containing protein [bacterium]